MSRKLTYSDKDLVGIIFNPPIGIKLSAKPDIIIEETEDEVDD